MRGGKRQIGAFQGVTIRHLQLRDEQTAGTAWAVDVVEARGKASEVQAPAEWRSKAFALPCTADTIGGEHARSGTDGSWTAM